MQRTITKEEIVNKLKLLDTRIKTLSEPSIDMILNNGFAELLAYIQPFTAEVIEPLEPHYLLGESTFVINIPFDVTYAYDLYLEKEGLDKSIFNEGKIKDRDQNVIWKDPHDDSIINVDLSYDKFNVSFDNAVVKFFYIPNADFVEISIGSDVYNALDTAFAVAAYDYLNDSEKYSIKKKILESRAMAIIDKYPNDFDESKKPKMFPYGT
jgi:hypothetical protein